MLPGQCEILFLGHIAKAGIVVPLPCHSGSGTLSETPEPICPDRLMALLSVGPCHLIEAKEVLFLLSTSLWQWLECGSGTK